jgi:hypothetical protein
VAFHIVYFSRDTLAGMLLESGLKNSNNVPEITCLVDGQSIIERLFARP